MNRKGFTLVELIAVIVIIGLIVAIALPRVLNQFANYQGDLSEKQKELIIEATRSYIAENEGQFIRGETTCLTLDFLVDKGILNGGFLENSDYNKTHRARVEHDGKKYIITVVEASACGTNPDNFLGDLSRLMRELIRQNN